MGFNLTDPKDAYDASQYGGIKFFAKKGGGAGRIRIKIPDSDTEPAGGKCQECFNDFGANVELTSSWTEYVLPFYLTKQEDGWGDTFNRIIPSALYGVQWQTNTPGASFDIWVDDIAFVGCDSATGTPAPGAAAATTPAAPPPPPPPEPAAAPADPSAPEPAPVPVE
jgi:endoglucanase